MRTITTLLFCVLCALCACDSKPAPSTVRVPMPDGSYQELPPGTTATLEWDEEIGSAMLKHEGSASGEGASVKGAGQEVSEKFNASAPRVLSPDGWGADGGGMTLDRSIIGRDPQEAVRSWMFWLGVALIAAAAGLWKFGRGQTALYAAAGGAGCIACAFFPGLAVLIFLAVAAVAFWPLIRAEIQRDRARKDAAKNKELNRSFAWARKYLPKELRDEFDKALAGQLETADAEYLEDLIVDERMNVPAVVPVPESTV